MVRAQNMRAAAILNDPRSSKAKQAMKELSGDERAIQLCDIEATAQLRAWKANLIPEMVIAYATSDPKMSPGTVDAEGAAFYNSGKWTNLRFICSISKDFAKVDNFAFAVGADIPPSEWEAYSLPAEMDDDDDDG